MAEITLEMIYNEMNRRFDSVELRLDKNERDIEELRGYVKDYVDKAISDLKLYVEYLVDSLRSETQEKLNELYSLINGFIEDMSQFNNESKDIVDTEMIQIRAQNRNQETRILRLERKAGVGSFAG